MGLMSRTPPRIVSVIMGTRNRPDQLRAALASIRALEGPDLRFEILVGDNGDTPETPLIVAEFGGIYDRTETFGCPAARNLALKRATGEFIALLDDDDVWLPGHVRPHILMLDANPDMAAVFGQVVLADDQLRELPADEQWIAAAPADGDVFRMMMSGFFPQVGATVIRAAIAREIGQMDESLIGDSDWDWQLRIARRHPIGFVEARCVLFRGRPPGSANRLQSMRVGYTRKIFLRHLRSNLSHWSSPLSIARSYFGALENYFCYFMATGMAEAEAGHRLSALRAFWLAFKTFPSRMLRRVATDRAVRGALLLSVFPGGRHHRQDEGCA
jgi:glycosyltransferase involved in cell wall biosynthesis